MALFSDINSLLESVKVTTRNYSFLFEHFDSNLRDVISSCALQDLVNSTIPRQTISNALISSLESTSQLALEEAARLQKSDLETISAQLWNPLVASLVKMLMVDLKSEKIISSPKQTNKQRKDVPKVAPKAVKLPAPAEADRIRSSLKAVALTRTRLYANTAHITCERDNCAFCKHLFMNVNITKCEGHKKCSASGWYPHVGKSLWSMLKAKHNALVPCKLRPQACKSSELPALQSESKTGSVGTSEQVEDIEFDDASSTHSQESVCTVRSAQSVPPILSWADDVEDQFRMVKRKRQPGSASAPGSPLHH